MGLPRALKAHKQNNIEEASFHYSRAYDQGIRNPVLFQNYGAILRKSGSIEKASEVYERGFRLFPTHLGIIGNYGNLLRSSKPSKALHIFFNGLHICLGSSEIPSEDKSSFYINIIDLLLDLNCYSWSLAVIRIAIHDIGINSGLLKGIILLLDDCDEFASDENLNLRIQKLIPDCIDSSNHVEVVAMYFALANHYRKNLNHDSVGFYYDRAMSEVNSISELSDADSGVMQEMIDINSWNYACSCLQSQNFELGWSLFEYGLRTPADGKQLWQRALVKPFSADQLPIWRGESGTNKRLLLLDEQAVGDVLMFSSLLSTLLNEFKQISLFTSSRLAPIFRRSFAHDLSTSKLSVYTSDDLANGILVSSSYDYQAAIGSICAYRFKSINDYSPKSPFLKPDLKLRNQLRSEYLNHRGSKELLVGVSWRGGGRGVRIQQKSIPSDVFPSLMTQHKNIRFVDLQYGNTAERVQQWMAKGIDIVHDPRINPLQDMDKWLAQVAACDAVLSVANTTIHGSGGLNLPTMCLLSKHYDWRWLHNKDAMRSYWYPSVGIAREHDALGWDSAFDKVSSWLSDGCPYPSGSISSQCA